MVHVSPITPLHPLHAGAGGGLETFFVAVVDPATSTESNNSPIDDETLLTGALTDYLRALYAAIFVPPSGNPTTIGVTCLSRPYVERRLRDSLDLLRGSPDAFVKEFVDDQPFNIPDPNWRIKSASLMAVINRRARNIDPALLALILLVYGTDALPNKIQQTWDGTFFLPVSDGTLAISPFTYQPTLSVARNIINMPTYWRWMDVIFPVDQGGYSQACVASIAAMTALPLSPASLVRTTMQYAAPPRPFANVMANLVTTRWLTAQRADATAPTCREAVAQWAQLRFFGYGAAELLDKSWFQGFYAERESVFKSFAGDAGVNDDEFLRSALALLVDGRLTKDHYDLTDICASEVLGVRKSAKARSLFLALAQEAAQEAAEDTPSDTAPKADTNGEIDPDDAELDPFDPDADVPTDVEDDTSDDSDTPAGGVDDDTIAPPDQGTGGVSDDSIEPFALTPKEGTLSAYLYRRAVHQLCTQLDLKTVSLSPNDATVLRWWCNQWLYIAPTTVTKSLIEKLGLAGSLRPFTNGA